MIWAVVGGVMGLATGWVLASRRTLELQQHLRDVYREKEKYRQLYNQR